jgi:hypothetical protein
MFRSSKRSSSGSSFFICLSMLLILKIIKIFKKYFQSIVVMWQRMFSVPVMRTVWRCEPAVLIQFVSSDDEHDVLETCREINKK